MNRFVTRSLLLVLLCGLFVAPAHAATAQDDAQAQLDATASAMLELQSFHFKLETTAGKTVFQDAVELRGVEGDVVRPADFQAAVSVHLAILDLTLEVVSLDGAIWVKNPIGGDDSFIQLTGAGSDFQLPPMEFINPDSLVQSALSFLENPEIAGSETVSGQEMTVITGTFDPSRLFNTGTPLIEDEGVTIAPASEPLDVKLWIDDQDRLTRIDFIGPLFTFEEGTGRLVRSITFSDFNGDITIQNPAAS